MNQGEDVDNEAASEMDQNVQEEPTTQVKNKRTSVRPIKYQNFVLPSLKKGAGSNLSYPKPRRFLALLTHLVC
jgi:hypothetical protein